MNGFSVVFLHNILSRFEHVIILSCHSLQKATSCFEGCFAEQKQVITNNKPKVKAA